MLCESQFAEVKPGKKASSFLKLRRTTFKSSSLGLPTEALAKVGGGEALNPSLIAYIGPSLTFTIQGTVLAA